jgi:hypothetical protein
MKLLRACIATCTYLLVLVFVYYLHVTYFKVNVVFYAAIMDAMVAVIAVALILFGCRYFKIFGYFEKIQLVLIWCLIGYALAISIPTVIDRSLSFYILEKLEQRGGGIKHSEFEQVFTQEYVHEHRLVDVRLTEQLASGTIVIKNGCVLLTDKGAQLAHLSRYFRQHWLPKNRLLMGVYSDDLTDPFRDSRVTKDYQCHQG